MKLTLPNSVSSRQDVQSLLLDVHEYARWFAHDAVKKRLRVKRSGEPPAISPAASEVIRDWGMLKPLSPATFDELVRALEEFQDAAPSITITLAAPAPGSLKKTLVDWCRKNIAPDILVNFEFNATLLGGIVVRCGSHLSDYSFRQQILDNRAKFPEILKHA